ncbi:AAA family ATPase [Pantoea sp. Bo_2]|uniref:toprim domain-containing protein n=1 Tax=unclassified Pantoea TaxID=2630326 RepID=UPI001232A276|nr:MULTISPECIES: toprim domain-containing protein [unclassified Pantoea]KAA5935352.1 AAA family ATPase [Pantoea sp. VH_3]KAA5944908.1 AAA family ATPase [Pantoea sp. VH_25]KAA5949416.1 AAA family ATPase [Pantoea sp. VH_24]KAA5955298.1 AAA family ATPase [Pantoea sp. VH_16]KAA5961359.1 AAA family ATPase [Pantoea sp. VH_18]
MTPAELSEKLWNSADRVAKYLLPNGHREANEWCVGSVSGEEGKSLKINLAGKKTWADFASGDSGDLLDLWVLVRNCGLHEAMREAKEFLGLKDDDHHFTAKKQTFARPKKQGVKKASQCYEYLASRGITQQTAERFRISDAVVWYGDEKRELPALAFPYIRNGELLQVKRISTERPGGKKVIMAEANCEPCLFGWQALDPKQRLLILCEGEIDCMSYAQLGYPALSVPFGGGKGAKQQWIEYEYHNLDRFDEILLSLDNDDVGREAARDIARRLGEHRCRLVELPYKDINECLTKGVSDDDIFGYLERSTYFDPSELCSASDLLQETIDAFEHRDAGLFTTPWTSLNYNFKFRASELTLVNGVNGHGKTELVGHIAIEAMAQNTRACIASLELKPGKMLARLTRQAICTATPTPQEITLCNAWFSENLWVFKLTGTAKADRLLEIFAYARRRYGIELFIIDNLAKCGFDEEDASGQKAFIDALCDFKNEHNCHVILVTHARKTDESVPTGKMDVKGTGALTDMPDNVMSVWRNIPREMAQRKLDKQGPQGLDEREKRALDMPPSIIRLLKQREGEGWIGDIGTTFDPRSHQFLENGKSAFNYLAAKPQSDIDADWEMNNVTRCA